jgi:hypothetical protein
MSTRHNVPADVVIDATRWRLRHDSFLRAIELAEFHYRDLAPWDRKTLHALIAQTAAEDTSLAARNLRHWFEEDGL